VRFSGTVAGRHGEWGLAKSFAEATTIQGPNYFMTGCGWCDAMAAGWGSATHWQILWDLARVVEHQRKRHFI